MMAGSRARLGRREPYVIDYNVRFGDRAVRGAPITFHPEVFRSHPDVAVYWDGVRKTPEGVVTTGGRVFTVVAAGSTVPDARERAYAALDHGIRFPGMHVRRDIGLSR